MTNAQASGYREAAARAPASEEAPLPMAKQGPVPIAEASRTAGRRARAVMVLGTTSGAGKSLITTALCRWYRRQGLDVAPFKAQNMSNNARVVDGGEIGTAQYLQALAARTRPGVAMNPLLLKPERDTRSQVVLNGRYDPALTALPWRERSARVWPRVRESLMTLLDRHEVVVIEGAGSPAEINLADSDFVNGRTASAADARCLLVADIDRGGAFAHLYGTHCLVDDETRSRIDGFVLNRFRGDPGLLAPGPAMLEQLTGVPTVGWLPYWSDHGLPEEDGPLDARFDDFGGSDGRLRVGIIAWPRISNLDEFEPLRRLDGVRAGWVRDPASIDHLDWLILPGSKHTSGDLHWLRERGFEPAIARHLRAGKPVLAICGGLQMLGKSLVDPHGVDGSDGGIDGGSNGGSNDGGDDGLGALPLATAFAATKTVRAATARFADLTGPWQALSGLAVDGYEIHHGQTRIIDPGPTEGASAACRGVLVADGRPGDGTDNATAAGSADTTIIGWQRGAILALYLHGLFENRQVMQALFGTPGRSLDEAFERLADGIDEHLDRAALLRLIGR